MIGWRLGKTSTPPLNADVAQSVEHRARRYVVGSSPTVCTRSSAHAKYKLNGLPGIEHKKEAETCTYRG